MCDGLGTIYHKHLFNNFSIIIQHDNVEDGLCVKEHIYTLGSWGELFIYMDNHHHKNLF